MNGAKNIFCDKNLRRQHPLVFEWNQSGLEQLEVKITLLLFCLFGVVVVVGLLVVVVVVVVVVIVDYQRISAKSGSHASAGLVVGWLEFIIFNLINN